MKPPEEIRSEVLRGFSARLVAARQAAGLSWAQLAERCGLHPSEISLFERGGRESRLGTLVKLAVALEVPPADLCAGAVWDPERRRFE